MPIPRYSMVLGRLVAEAVKCIVIATVIVLIALPFGIAIASGPLGFVLIVVLSALWGFDTASLQGGPDEQRA